MSASDVINHNFRPSRIAMYVVLLLVGGELVMFGIGTQQILGSGCDMGLGSLPLVTLSLGIGAAGAVGLISSRRRSQQLARRLNAMIENGRLSQIEPAGGEDPALADAISNVVQFACDAVARANLQAKELEIQLKVATAERQHAQAIIRSISDAVIVTDRFDEVVLANEAAAKIFEFDLAQAARTSVSKVLRDRKMVEMICEMRQSNSRAERRVVEHRIDGPSGARVYQATMSSVVDRNGEPAGVVTVLRDMTREMEVAQMKNDFVSSVSHELRTPLASIRAYIEMLIDGEADDEKTRGEFYEVIQNEANRLGRLIDDILNISRIESGLVKVNKQPQSLTVIVKEAIEVIQPQARQKNITISEELAPIFYQTLADHDMLYQAVLNLLSNAVKYTPDAGTITVRTVVDESKKTISAQIADSGVGIPAKDLPFVFEKFYRAESNSRMAKGTGLGLSLVKQIIQTVHQGRILADSQVGKGSCFGFELPLCE